MHALFNVEDSKTPAILTILLKVLRNIKKQQHETVNYIRIPNVFNKVFNKTH